MAENRDSKKSAPEIYAYELAVSPSTLPAWRQLASKPAATATVAPALNLQSVPTVVWLGGAAVLALLILRG